MLEQQTWTPAVATMKKLLQTCGSVRLAVILLALAMILVYVGSWAQMHADIYQVQKNYFHCWLTFIHPSTVLPRLAGHSWAVSGGLPFPGGYTIGLLLLVNLVAAQLSRVPFTWRRAGIHLAHLGVLLLLAGEAWSSVATVESRMVIREGESASYAEDVQRMELAFIDRTPADREDVVALAASELRSGATVSDPRLPVQVRVDEWHRNSELSGPMSEDGASLTPARARARPCTLR